jgi:PAS domain S-box-containing protein
MNQDQLSQRFLNQSKDFIWIIDLEFRLIYANAAYQHFMKESTGSEKKLDELVFVEDFGEEAHIKWKDYYARAIKGEHFEIEEQFYHLKTKETQYNQVSFKPIYDDDKKISAAACEARDISNFVKKRYESNKLIDASLDVFCSIDEDGNFVHVSAAAKAQWGYSPEELEGTPYIDLALDEDVPKTNAIAADIMAGQEIRTFVNRYRKKDGEIAYNSWSARWDSEVKIMYCVARDTKEKIKQEDVLHQSEQRFKALVQEGSDLIGILDVEGNYKYVSPTSTAVLGISPEEFVGRSAFEFIHPEDAERVIECLQKLETTNRVKIEAFRFQNNKKEWRWIETVLTNMLDNPAVNGIVSNSRDITEDKKLRKLSKQANELAKVGGWEYDLINDELIWSDEVHELHETDSETFFPNVERAIHFYKEEHKSFVEGNIQKSLNEGVYLDYEAIIITKSKKERWVRVIASPEFSEGNCVKFIGSFQDITDRKETESRLQSLADNLPGVAFQYVIYPDGKDQLKYVSEGSKKLWGYPAKRAIENNELVWDQIKAGGDYEHVKSSIFYSVENKEQWNARWNYVMPSGEIKTHVGYGSPKFFADGSVQFNSLIFDITDQVETERSFEQAIALSKIGIWDYEVRSGKVMMSDMVHEIFETDPLTFSPDLETAINFFREDFREEAHRKINQCISTGEPQNFEAILISAENNERWVQVKGDALFIKGKCVKVYGSFQDVDNLKTLELEVTEILGSISDPFQVLDANWKFKYFNKEAELLLQKSKKEVIGEVIWDVFPEKVGTALEEVFKRVARTGEQESIEYLFSEENIWYEVNVYPFQGGVSTYFKNINERKRASENLKAAFKEKNNILESIGDAFYALNKEWVITYWNKKAEDFNGILKDEAIGSSIWDLFPDSIDTEFYHNYHHAMKTGETVRFESKYETSGRWYEVIAYPSQEGLSIYLRDITLRKKADQRLLEANERFEKVTEATNDAIWDWEIKAENLYWGGGYKKLFGYDLQKTNVNLEFYKKNIHPEDREAVILGLEKVLDSPEDKWTDEYRYRRFDGTYASVIDRGVIIRDSIGNPTRMVGAMTDVSERIQSQKELKELNESLKKYSLELERSNEELEQFAFVTSHDMQEPLRMISSFMDQLKSKYGDQLDEKALQYIHFATDGAKRMKQIILDLLQYSRANRPDEEIEEVDLNEVLSAFKELRRKLISENSVSILSEKLPTLKTYSALITQIFHCLMDNAIKYSKKDIDTVIEIKSIEKESEWEFSIKDNGLGIDPQFFEKIFIIFQRLHNRDEYEGTGIGLPIAKRSVEFLGGQIWLESQVGEGTTFFFTLPKNNLNNY